MKVCAVTTWPPHRDGVALYSAELYRHMSGLADVSVVGNIAEWSSPGENQEDRGLSVLRTWRRGSLTYPFKVFRSVLDEGPSIVHLQHGWLLYGGPISSILFPLLLVFLRVSRKKTVVTMHTVTSKKQPLYGNPLLDFAARILTLFISKSIIELSDKIVVHNDLMSENLRRMVALKEDSKVVVIPHGVRMASGKPMVVEEERRFRILSLGFLRKSKGIEHIIVAFEKFYRNYPDSELVIVGGQHAHDKNLSIEIFKNLLSSKASQHVFFTGFAEEKELDDLIWRSDVIVLHTAERNYVEASGALGRFADYEKPLICSQVPKFQSELRDKENCIMTLPCDSSEMAQALSMLARSASLRKRLGRNLKERFKGRGWRRVAEDHSELFKSLLSS
ncbi:MAG TPA: glycosyltransferase [Candidatus Bathyarchaeia archaeon]|nr:glycosyltransferase [Candidatus Bathyarchaeia archaeon]